MGEWSDWCEMREHTHLERDPERFKDEEPTIYPEKIESVLDMPWGTKVWEHKWFDFTCDMRGCQSLVHKHKMDRIKAVLDNADLTDYYMIQDINRIVNG